MMLENLIAFYFFDLINNIIKQACRTMNKFPPKCGCAFAFSRAKCHDNLASGNDAELSSVEAHRLTNFSAMMKLAPSFTTSRSKSRPKSEGGRRKILTVPLFPYWMR